MWLALNQPDYSRLAVDARDVHETPNLYLTALLREKWHDADERAGIQDEGYDVGTRARPADDIPF